MSLGDWARRADTPLGHSLLLGIAVSVAVTAVSRLGGLAGWETRAIDAFLYFRDRVPTPEIVLVHIDDAAFAEMGERQPLPRRYLAELGEFLLQSGARVVGFDILLTKATTPAEDGALIALTRRWEERGGRLVFTTVANPVGDPGRPRFAVAPPFSPEVRAAFGFANAPIGGDGLVRKATPVLPAAAGGYLPSFAMAVLAGYEGAPPSELARALASDRPIVLPIGDPRKGITGHDAVSIATLRDAVWRIDYVGQPGAFASFPAGALMALARSGVRPEADNPFKGKIVLVGATFAEGRDFYGTPMGLMAGVEIQANIVHTLLSRRALLPPPWALNVALLAAGCLWISLLSVRLRQRWVVVLTLGLVAALVVLSYEAYSRGYWLDFIAPLAVMRFYRQGSAYLARRRLNSAFGQYVSPEVLERVLREGSRLGGEVRTVSVLMSDVRGFTTLSEKLPPTRISEIMNEYFTAMVDVIMSHHGMVNDFIGDGILAIYGAPLDDPDHAWHAVQSAIGMQQALARLNEEWQKRGAVTLAMGVAVNTGQVFAGNMGSPRKKKYSVLGDTVNTVARMEGLNRDLGTGILISAETLAAVRGRVVFRERGRVMVKGKTQPVELFELLDLRPA